MIELANNKLTKTNEKLVALYEINHILHNFRDDFDVLTDNLVNTITAIMDSKDGALFVKNQFSNTYQVIYSSSSDLNEHTFTESILDKTQKTDTKDGHYLIVNLDDQGALVVKRDLDSPEYENSQLFFLMLISEQLAVIIKEASEKDDEKAKKMLSRKQFDI